MRTDDGLVFEFPFNPYTSFFEIGGYLAEGEWKLEPGMYVLDAGGERGEFSLYASRKVGQTGRVIMLEPDPQSRQLAQQTFGANGGQPENLVVVDQGLWKEPGQLMFASGLGGSSVLVDAGTQIAASAQSAGAALMSIKVQSLASLIETMNLPRLDLVKMDIEGAELEATEKIGQVLERHRPRFSIASYHVRDGEMTSKGLEAMFRDYGYCVRTGFPLHQTTYAWPKELD